jgi:hypothetical protein
MVLKVQASIATMTSKPSASSSGLSPGAKVEIGLGTIFGVIFVALGVYLVFIRSRRMGENSGQGAVRPDQDKNLLEMEDQNQEHASRRLFHGGAWRAEVDGESRAREVDAGGDGNVAVMPVDLEGGRVRYQ